MESIEVVGQSVCVILRKFSDKSRQIVVVFGCESFELNNNLHVARWNRNIRDRGFSRKRIENSTVV